MHDSSTVQLGTANDIFLTNEFDVFTSFSFGNILFGVRCKEYEYHWKVHRFYIRDEFVERHSQSGGREVTKTERRLDTWSSDPKRNENRLRTYHEKFSQSLFQYDPGNRGHLEYLSSIGWEDEIHDTYLVPFRYRR